MPGCSRRARATNPVCATGHTLVENRNCLIVDVQNTYASGIAELEAALAMFKRRCDKNKRAAVGADKSNDSRTFIKDCRKLKVRPHVAVKDKHLAVNTAASSATRVARPA